MENIHSQAIELGIDFEILVYEDGSKEFLEINRKIASLSKVDYKFLPKNIGRTALRTSMAKNAKFEYCLFLDADVFPKNGDFLKKYFQIITTNPDVVFGGISYQTEKPERHQILRWKYGKEREAKTVEKRMESPYFIISQNLLIKKDVFIKANDLQENLYGLDNYFSGRLKVLQAKIIHIDNTVIHRGLETSEKFIKKALEAVKTTVILENRNLMDNNIRPIQKSYLKLKKMKMVSLYSFLISPFIALMERNFQSGNPNLFWFDLYRLNYYIDLKKKLNA